MQNPSINNLFGVSKNYTDNTPNKTQMSRNEPINIKNLETGEYQVKMDKTNSKKPKKK